MRKIITPLTDSVLQSLKAGEAILLTGVIYTARDQAHQRLADLLMRNKKLPFNLGNQAIYYCGPTATPEGKVIGSCGPTTSSRMDKFTPALLKAGLKAMIGKGSRSKEVTAAIKKYKAAYFLAPAGCGALLAQKVKSAKVVAFSELGPEAVRRLELEDFPLIVGIDTRGDSLY